MTLVVGAGNAELGIPQSDMLLQMVGKTHDLLTELKMHAHYLSCDGVGAITTQTD